MTDKERFEELAYNVGISLDREKAIMSSDDYDFLYNYTLEQAERVHELEQQNKNYRKAIKGCIERMNEGGAGTRSFVYEKLIEVLEGEK